MPLADNVDITAPVRCMAWIVGLVLVGIVVRHASSLWALVSDAFRSVFGFTPVSAIVYACDRIAVWTLVVVLLSMALPHPMGERLRSGWWSLLRFCAAGAGRLARLAFSALRLLVEGAVPTDRHQRP